VHYSDVSVNEVECSALAQLNDLFTDTKQQLEDTTKELEETGKKLEETSDNLCVRTTQLRHMTQDRDEHQHLVGVRVDTESQLHSQATQVFHLVLMEIFCSIKKFRPFKTVHSVFKKARMGCCTCTPHRFFLLFLWKFLPS